MVQQSPKTEEMMKLRPKSRPRLLVTTYLLFLFIDLRERGNQQVEVREKY